MKINNNAKKTIIHSMLSGVAIGIGGIINLISTNNLIGGVLFSFGLYATLLFDLYLYTGKVSSLATTSYKEIPKILLIILGNFIGTFLVACLTVLSGTNFYEPVIKIVCNKTELNCINIFTRSILCGILVYAAVKSHTIIKTSFNFFPMICVLIFVIGGFDHSIANMYYISTYWLSSGMFSVKHLYVLFVSLIGNAIGCNVIPICKKYCI